ncbi:hypothetical protein BCR34DRAFT_318923 [Clohesyomyces aquaticus]|uniref:Uncharacterized protein n=1 Tax=Clohesyomyces aquaticus TaxID=1231657 RepID=A0A1Y1ZNQ9_9PLEO|nr:hypothetical protein BCR34DRAFT_318923 [Clohesyomyces aquaticus]
MFKLNFNPPEASTSDFSSYYPRGLLRTSARPFALNNPTIRLHRGLSVKSRRNFGLHIFCTHVDELFKCIVPPRPTNHNILQHGRHVIKRIGEGSILAQPSSTVYYHPNSLSFLGRPPLIVTSDRTQRMTDPKTQASSIITVASRGTSST